MNEVLKMFAKLVQGFEDGEIKYLKNSKSKFEITRIFFKDNEVVIETGLFQMMICENNIHGLKIDGENVSMKMS